MRKIITISLLSFSAVCFSGNFFEVTGTSSLMTINLTIPTKLNYKYVGIQMTGGYTLTKPGNECKMNSQGYCIFELSRSTPKKLSISGSGDQVKAIICLNGNGPLSCQHAFYRVAGGVTYTDYVYVVQPTSIKLCLADDKGNLSHCQDSGATGLVGAQSIVFDSTQRYAYISTKGAGNQPATGGITSCAVNSTTKLLSTCSSTSLGPLPNLPQQLAYLHDLNADYIYMAASPYDGSTGATVYRCTVNNGLVNSCSTPVQNTGASRNITGIAINQGAPTYAYVIDNDNSTLQNCTVNTGANTLSCVSTFATMNNPEFVSINPAQTGVYLPFYTGPVVFFPITNNEVVSTGSIEAGHAFNQPKQSTPNSTGTFAFVSNHGNNTVSVCPITENNSFLACQLSSETFVSPTGISVLPY